ncbi:fimbrial assembly protein FimA [Ventosimonas gracilis]|uniref:Fimbrial assembly protein FimA n=1 Tax=Ventosimonas gracilis TaxID=1680762 RepID=A0A139SIV5_9GAMM|nr:DUF1028 domain-containing protein [Ventosimonas gracilis]KXU34451.1 fimbrial assembly protein FimA [Ventosimonas gracilis]
MTFSIIGRCEQSGQIGIAISSSSIAVGARCPWLRAGVGAVSTQNITLPAYGTQLLNLLAQGLSPERALKQATENEAYCQYRQIILMNNQGETAVFSGSKTLGIYNTAAGKQCIAAGNLLKAPQVIAALTTAFEQTRGHLADRLLAAMQAALNAGGEAGPVHSAALSIVDCTNPAVNWPIVDLRVDWADDNPIGELAKLWQAYQMQMDDYITRALNPASAPSYGVPGDE